MLYHLTNQCQMACPHCMVDAKPVGNHASMETTAAMVRFLNECMDPVLNIGGGEPTEHPQAIEHLEYILTNACCAAFILATNGSFLFDQKLTEQIAELSKAFDLKIQVSAIEPLYPQAREVAAKYMNAVEMFGDNIHLVDRLTCIDQLGRAKGKDWSHITTYERKGPNCFNLFSIARSGQVPNLPMAIAMQASRGKFCKPLVSNDGTIRAGESPFCTSLGNVHNDTPESVYEALKTENPCGACGVALPFDLNGEYPCVNSQ